MSKDLNEVLNYMKQYVEDKYKHVSEPMLNYKDLQLVLEEIERLNSIIKEVREYIKNNETTFKVNDVVNAFGIPTMEFTIELWKKDVLEILDKGE